MTASATTSTTTTDPAAAHAQVTEAVLDDLDGGRHPAVIVDSPPGAGKSTFVVQAARHLSAATGGPIPIVAQTNAQADDLVDKLAATHTDLHIGRLLGGSHIPPYQANSRLSLSKKIGDLPDAEVIVATSAKWAYVSDDMFPVGIIDEAYQMRSDQLLYVADLFPRALMVGDPGQLDPFTPADDSRWKSQPDGPVSPAVATVRHNHPEIEPHKLPVSWRLSARCAPLVSAAFYPALPFRAGTSEADRQLTDTAERPSEPAADGIHDAIDHAVEAGWAMLELPAKISPGVDAEAVDAVAMTVVGLLQRQIEAVDSGGDSGPVGPSRIAVGVAHRIQRSAVQIRLDELGRQVGLDVTGVAVDTANRLQGREFHVVVVLHPLSGRAAASEFHLETGRLCVLLSRHRHACIVVARHGINDVLDAHPMSQPIWIGAPLPIPDGWEANQSVLEQLASHRVSLPG